MDDVIASVAQFQKQKLGNLLAPSAARCPALNKSGQTVKANNIQMVAEEAAELCAGLAHDDIGRIADGLGDLLYVIAGVAVTYGVPLKAVFVEVHLANMRKEHDPNAADGGKPVLKPEGWQPPRIIEVLEAHGGVRIK